MFTKTYEGITLQPIYTPALHGEAIPRGYTLGQVSSYVAQRQVVILKTLGVYPNM